MALEYNIYCAKHLDETSISGILKDIGLIGVFEKTSEIAKDFISKDSRGLYITFVEPSHGEWFYTENEIEKTFLSSMFISFRLDKQMDYLVMKRLIIKFLNKIVEIGEDILFQFVGDEILLKLENGKLTLSNSGFWENEWRQMITMEFYSADFES